MSRVEPSCLVRQEVRNKIHQAHPFDRGSFCHHWLDRVLNLWPVLLLYALAEGTKRSSELERELAGISRRSLVRALRGLEADHLIERKVYAVVPPMVEYSLTSAGASLIEPLASVCEWVAEHEKMLGQSLPAKQA
jgi:DNA-binding HxlR family transcriptional regulator